MMMVMLTLKFFNNHHFVDIKCAVTIVLFRP
jgi:hypothetical protein